MCLCYFLQQKLIHITQVGDVHQEGTQNQRFCSKVCCTLSDFALAGVWTELCSPRNHITCLLYVLVLYGLPDIYISISFKPNIFRTSPVTMLWIIKALWHLYCSLDHVSAKYKTFAQIVITTDSHKGRCSLTFLCPSSRGYHRYYFLSTSVSTSVDTVHPFPIYSLIVECCI